MSPDPRTQFKQWLETGQARLQPLTLPQRELWETSPVPVADPANHICGVIEIKGPITPQQCEAAIQRVIERQEALRISFLPGKERPLQMVRATGTTLLGVRELAAGGSLEDLLLETYRQPFDLLLGPLHRVDMIRRGHHDHVLAFSFHHAIADGWSLGVFVQDLCTAYIMDLTGLRKTVAVGMMGLRHTLPPVAQTYTEWAAAERAAWQPAELARCAGYWQSRLAGSGGIWGGAAAAGPLRRQVSALPADLVRGVKLLAVNHGSTLFSVLLAAFQLTIAKWTGKHDLVVGTPVANRNKEAVRQTMGYFAGVVPLRGQVDFAQSFSKHLRAVTAAALDAFAHAMPFAELAVAMEATRVAGGHTLFDVRFALQNHPVPDVVLPRISTKLRMRSTGTARFDLGCELTEVGSEMELVWLFKPGRIPAAELAGLHDLFLAVLAAVARNPEGRMGDLTV